MKLRWWVLLSLGLFPGVALSQFCEIAVYADPVGTESSLSISEYFTPHFVYVLMLHQGEVRSVSYAISFPSLFDPETNPSGSVIVTDALFGPKETGVDVPSPGGSNIDLGLCAPGFDGQWIQAARYEIVATDWFPSDYVRLGPNVDVDPELVMFTNCEGNVQPCEITGEMLLEILDLPAESHSWGAVKSLFAF